MNFRAKIHAPEKNMIVKIGAKKGLGVHFQQGKKEGLTLCYTLLDFMYYSHDKKGTVKCNQNG